MTPTASRGCGGSGAPARRRCSSRSPTTRARERRRRPTGARGRLSAMTRGIVAPPFALAATLHLGEFLPPLLVCVAYLALYGKRARTLAGERRPVARWRVVSFVSGVLLMTAVQLPPLDDLADKLLVAHMVQHLVIGDLASLFIVLGLTGPVLQPLLQMRPSRPLRQLASPVVALVLVALDLYAWHVPFFYQLAIRHDLVHALEHACMLWFGVLLWLAPIGPPPHPRRCTRCGA